MSFYDQPCNRALGYNGKSQFGVGQEGVKIEIGAVVIDDTHACIATTENQFSLAIPSNHVVFRKLLALFKDDLMTQSLAGVTELGQGDPYALVTLPYWAWINKQAPAMQILLEARGLNEFDFTWPLIKENLHLCTCVFSGRRLEITPPCLPIHAIPSFIQARRRIYMTATLSDDSVLISHFNADISSVQQPITPKNASDIGDRMILIPQELNPDTTEEEIKQFVSRLV